MKFLIKSDCLFNGYYNRDDLNTEIFQNGYFKTGDLGFIYRDNLFLTGRIKDIIISNGVNVYPHDVEAILNNTASLIPGRNVVFGITDEKSGTETIIALAETTGASLDFVKIKASIFKRTKYYN